MQGVWRVRLLHTPRPPAGLRPAIRHILSSSSGAAEEAYSNTPYSIVGRPYIFHLACTTLAWSPLGSINSPKANVAFFARLPQAKAVFAARRLNICAPQARKIFRREPLLSVLHTPSPYSVEYHTPCMGARQPTAGAAVEALPAAVGRRRRAGRCKLLAAGAARRRRRKN